tara:strand:- start:5595 stop:6143 length:549 start_codon:yes stop_codon:yes gene_type:complete
MTDPNLLSTNTWFYNKYIKNKNDNNFSNINKTKIQYTQKDLMFTNIININNLDSLITYDDNISENIPESLNKYYQTYPTIDLNNKIILNNIYDIYNINDLKKWISNNKTKNKITINRILDLAWKEFYNKIFIEKEFIFNLYISMYKKKTDDIDSLKKKLKIIFKNYNPTKKQLFSEYLIMNI